MKKVWVNRFNADGTLKPMSEWVQRECAERYTHTYPLLNDGHGFDGGGLPAHHCFISSFGKIAESGFFYEYIGDQRGDGWFYVELGQLPPSYDDDILLWNDGRFFVCQYDGINGKYEHRFIGANEHIFIGKGHRARWKPLQPPKYLK